MTEEIIFKASVDTGDTINDLNAITKANERVSESTEQVGKDYTKAFNDIKNKVESGTLTQRELTKAVREYQTIALQAGESSPIGKQAIAEAGQLKDRLGDLQASVNVLGHDGANMQAALQLGQTVTAGYGAFQGVLALTGNQSEALTETLVKLEAVQVTLTSVEQIRAALEKESFLMIKAKTLWTNLQTAASNKLTIAEIAKNGVVAVSTGVTAAATTAMAALNAVMLLNPVFLLIAAFAAVAGAIALFGGSADHAAEDNERLNASIEKSNELLDASNEKMVRNANNQLKLAQARGASEDEILSKQLQILKTEEKARTNQIGQLKRQIQLKADVLNQAIREHDEDTIESANNEVKSLHDKYKKLKSLDGQYYTDKKIMITSFDTKQREQAKKEAEKQAQEAEQAQKEQAQKNKEAYERRLQQQKEAEQKRLELERTITDLAVANIEDEWQRKFTALAVAQQREREELVKKYGANSTLEAELKKKQANELMALDAEQAKTEQASIDKIAQEKKQREQTDRVAELEGRLIQMKGEFEAEMEIKEELAVIERDRQLANQELTDGEKFKIEQEFNAKMIALGDERTAEDKKNAEATLQARKELIGGVTTILGNLQQLSKKNSASQKAFAIADIAIQTATGFMDGLRLAQKAAIETPTPVGKALVFGSFITSQFLAVKNAVNKAKEAIGGGVNSVSPPSTSSASGGGSGSTASIVGNEVGTNTTTSTTNLVNSGSQVVLVLDSLEKTQMLSAQTQAVATRG
mgnify:CR=1 FL=1|tara:strand:- start:7426 stop:9693 length:2268 start_codon:yes stop_codon:yes gene_type:complete